MFNTIRDLFLQESTKEEFKNFLQQLNQLAEEKNKIGYLGLTKALHNVAELLYEKNWQTLDGLSAKAGKNSVGGFYVLHYVERPAHSRNTDTIKACRHWQDAVGSLWDYVSQRINDCCRHEFMETHPELFEEYMFLEEEDAWDNSEVFSGFLGLLKWNDIAMLIEWYFDLMNDDYNVAFFDIVFHSNRDDAHGSTVDLKYAHEDQGGHPLLDKVGVRIKPKHQKSGQERYCIEGFAPMAGQTFETEAVAAHEAVKAVVKRAYEVNDPMEIGHFYDLQLDHQIKFAFNAVQGA